uniref:Galactosyltransferase C-terminal domain-containing protein n=1 Tax=viral metagenome TaxID=1070528 RepID=A0A6C0BXR5_9ZZZZ
MSLSNIIIPKRIFIVPYRNRREQKFFFSNQMTFILGNDVDSDYEIYFVHQCDNRNFNRGATKNIGFLAMKEKYPNDYKNINFIFNDVDTLPFHKLFDYETTRGVIKHYYGFTTALGGIVVIRGADFERINGYPNYWGWGMEDACLEKRASFMKIQIDRSQFYTIGSPEILQLFDGVSRMVSRKDPFRMKNDTGVDGIRSIKNFAYTIDDKSLNPNDNIYVVENTRIQVVNVTHFTTLVDANADVYHDYDLREPVRNIMYPAANVKKSEKSVVGTEDWKNIPYYPTVLEKKENEMKNIERKYIHTPSPQGQLQKPISAKYYFSKEYARNHYPAPRSIASANVPFVTRSTSSIGAARRR